MASMEIAATDIMVAISNTKDNDCDGVRDGRMDMVACPRRGLLRKTHSPMPIPFPPSLRA